MAFAYNKLLCLRILYSSRVIPGGRSMANSIAWADLQRRGPAFRISTWGGAFVATMLPPDDEEGERKGMSG